MPSERSKYSKDQHQLRASLEADDNDNMKNFTVFFFFLCTFAALGFSGPILEPDLWSTDYTGLSGGCFEYHEDVCQEVNGRTECMAIPRVLCA